MPKCVVAEDESLLREALLEQLIKAWPNLEIVAACDDGASALEAIIAIALALNASIVSNAAAEAPIIASIRPSVSASR